MLSRVEEHALIPHWLDLRVLLFCFSFLFVHSRLTSIAAHVKFDLPKRKTVGAGKGGGASGGPAASTAGFPFGNARS
jgi:hypothetical protein